MISKTSLSSDLTLPSRCHLAHLPTPLEYCRHLSNKYSSSVWIKRDDLTGVGLSGNKVRKLEFLLSDAQQQNSDVIITCGGVNSNHARATAVACARLGLSSHLLLRGQPHNPLTGNLLLDKLLDTEITFIERHQWPERNILMQDIANAYKEKGQKAYIIPEGGSNAVGLMGYVIAAQEILEQMEQVGDKLSKVVHAGSSCGTTAGLALGFAALGSHVEVVAIAVSDDEAYLNGRVKVLLDEAVDRGYVSKELASQASWSIRDGFIGSGYAQTTEQALKRYQDFAKNTGVFVDPVYTGKGYDGLVAELQSEVEGEIVFVHTGGIYEWFAFAEQFPNFFKI